MSDSSASPPIDLGPYAGVQLLAIFAAMAMWGITCMQTFLFYFNNRGDRLYLKLLVAWLWVMDTVHQGLLISGNYKATVTGDVSITNNVRVEYVISILFTTFVSVPTQTFFAWRIWRFGASSRWIFLSILIPAILFQFAEGIVLIDIDLGAQLATQVTGSTSRALIITYFAVGAAVDIIIAVGMCLLLWQSYITSGAAIQETTTMLQRLILFSINTGSWTAAFALCSLAMLVKFPGNFLFVGFYFILSPLYCNTLLANLNARSYIRGTEQKSRVINLSVLQNTMGEHNSHTAGTYSRTTASEVPTSTFGNKPHAIELSTLSQLEGKNSEDDHV